MELAGAALGGDADQHAGIAAVLRREGAGLQLELADRIQADLGVLAVVRAHVGVDRTVEVHVVHAAAQPVHLERIRIVESQAEIAGIVRDDAGQSADQRLEVAAVQALFGDLIAGQHKAAVGRTRFDKRRDGFDAHRVGGGANLKRKLAEIHRLVGIENQTRAGAGFEAGGFYFNGVGAAQEFEQAEAAAAVGVAFAGDDPFSFICCRDLGIDDRSAAGVGDLALYVARLGQRADS